MIGVFVQVNESSRYATAHPIGYVICENGCWEWVGDRNTKAGHGRLWDGKRKVLAHRFMFERVRGPVPGGMDLDHVACDNPPCCNPFHVEPATHRDNLMRGNGACANHARQTHCKRGHPLSGDNLLHYELSRGVRRCRICNNLKYKARTK